MTARTDRIHELPELAALLREADHVLIVARMARAGARPPKRPALGRRA